jgi:hypothetical protein
MKLLEAVCFGGAIIFTLSFIIKNLACIHMKLKIPGQESNAYIAMILWILWYYLSH